MYLKILKMKINYTLSVPLNQKNVELGRHISFNVQSDYFRVQNERIFII